MSYPREPLSNRDAAREALCREEWLTNPSPEVLDGLQSLEEDHEVYCGARGWTLTQAGQWMCMARLSRIGIGSVLGSDCWWQREEGSRKALTPKHREEEAAYLYVATPIPGIGHLFTFSAEGVAVPILEGAPMMPIRWASDAEKSAAWEGCMVVGPSTIQEIK